MINVGIVGCGRIFKKHLTAVQEHKKLKLIAICDTKKSALNKYKHLNVKKYTNVNKMLSHENIDLITILTPSGYHYKNFIEVHKKVKNILIEKPLTTNLVDAKKIYSTAKKFQNEVFVVMQNRFNKPIIALKKILDEKKIGKVFLTSARVRWARDEKYYDLAEWRGTKKNDGGVLFNQAAHHVDMLTYLNGSIKRVRSIKKNLIIKNIDHEDTIVASIEYRNGSIGTLEVTVATRPRDLEGSISILGNKGSVEISGFSMDEIKHWDFYKNYKKPITKAHKHIYGIGHIQLYGEICKAIKGRKNIAPTVKDGYENVKLIEKIYQSVK